MSLRRPGIYQSQQIQYPPLQANLQPAVPALIGFTEFALDPDGNSLHLKPTRLDSIEAFHAWFGKGFSPNFTVTLAADGTITDLSPNSRFYLYDSLRLFFENGGRDIYIVSTGTYRTKLASPSSDRTELEAGVDALAYFDEPDLVFFPDAMRMDFADIGRLEDHCLAHCRKEKFRFAIFDLLPDTTPLRTVDHFRKHLGKEHLDLGAAYHPWIQTGLDFEVGLKQLEFKILEGNPQGPIKPISGGPREVPSSASSKVTDKPVSSSAELPRERPLPTVEEEKLPRERPLSAVEEEKLPRERPLPAVEKEPDWQEVISGLISVSQEEFLTKYNFSPLEEHHKKLQDALLEAPYQDVEKRFLAYMEFARSLVLAFGKLFRGVEKLPPELKELLFHFRENREIQRAMSRILSYEQHRTLSSMQNLSTKQLSLWYGSMIGPENWIPAWPLANGANFSDVVLNPEKLEEAPKVIGKVRFPTALSAAQGILNESPFSNSIRVLIAAYGQLFLTTASPVSGTASVKPSPEQIETARQQAVRLLQYLPPSGAICGLISLTDRNRGTYKAPANQGLAQVIAPGNYLNHYEQGYYNVHPTGKSVNALVPVVGEGIVVNGSRTLKSNDSAWRYVPVRRYFLAIEKVLKRILGQYVFEPNSAPTWDLIRGQVGLFLEEQRKSGALQGKNAAEAWELRVGEGLTMSAQDILQGRLIVHIGLAVARPAEFIVLTLIQQLENN